jgi:uncharacterized OB-fold protein
MDMSDKENLKDYSYVMDIFPQQNKDETKLWGFFENLRQGKLTTIKCKNCGHTSWPPEAICPACLSEDIEYVEMPKTGKVYAFSVQVGALPPQFKAPLIHAIVDFDNGIRVLSSIVETDPKDIHVGDEVELKVMSIPPDSHGDRVLFFFRKV